MKRNIILIWILLAFIGLSLQSCGEGESTKAVDPNIPSEIVGTWKLKSMEMDGEVIGMEDENQIIKFTNRGKMTIQKQDAKPEAIDFTYKDGGISSIKGDWKVSNISGDQLTYIYSLDGDAVKYNYVKSK